MKKLNVLLVVSAFVICSVGTIKANTKPIDSKTNLTEEIQDLLKKPSFNIENEIKASVSFTLNNQGEIVVLSVDSENDIVKVYIKNRLNYQKVKTELDDNIKFYTMPVRLVI